MNKISIIIPCAILDTNNKIEIDRFSRFQEQLRNIASIPNKPDNIRWVFIEVYETKPLLRDTISKFVPNSICFEHKKPVEQKFNQVKLWYDYVDRANSDGWEDDFIVFTHSDILFSKNLYKVLNSRVIDKSKNYYAFRYDTMKRDREITNNEVGIRELPCSDYGFDYILEHHGFSPTNSIISAYYINTDTIVNIQPKQIPESFMCISLDNFKRFDREKLTVGTYHNDVVIRDLSVVYGIKHEWLNDELVLLHMRGLDDMNKTVKSDYNTTEEIIKNIPELQHFGMFRFHPRFLPYMKTIDKRYIYEKYIKNKVPQQYSPEGFI